MRWQTGGTVAAYAALRVKKLLELSWDQPFYKVVHYLLAHEFLTGVLGCPKKRVVFFPDLLGTKAFPGKHDAIRTTIWQVYIASLV